MSGGWAQMSPALGRKKNPATKDAWPQGDRKWLDHHLTKKGRTDEQIINDNLGKTNRFTVVFSTR